MAAGQDASKAHLFGQAKGQGADIGAKDEATVNNDGKSDSDLSSQS